MDDPSARIISAEEESWLLRNLTHGRTAWNCVARQVMMMALDRRTAPDMPDPIYNDDTWPA